MEHRLSLDLGERSYDIVIGASLLPRLGQLLQPLVQQQRVAIVTNTTVAPLYLERVTQSLQHVGISSLPIILTDGESFKNWHSLNQIFDTLIEQRFERSTVLITLGGGVIGDIGGFAAACFLRGIPFIQIPTTLLSQVDASVGGKTGINHPLGKNLIGAFYQPRLVVIDSDTLSTLPRRELLAGYAEIIKYGIIADASLFSLLEAHVEGLLRLDNPLLIDVIHRCCAIKAQVVAADERENGQRALLNLGHTFGHAIETLTHYESWLHGEAVAVGMIMAAELASALQICAAQDVTRIRTLIRRFGLPIVGPSNPTSSNVSIDAWMDAMSRDKKVEGGQFRFVLPQGIGKATIYRNPPVSMIAQAITSCSAKKA
ncbi:MAG: 3-dehydroquinate synthase [Magnetococcales bacterium]|nr:3-dehydroquinate synthase [Magnetococcales bacterium]